MTTEMLTADDLTRADKFALDEAVDSMTCHDSARVSGRSDVWATVQCDTDDYSDVLAAAVESRDVVVHHAERHDPFVGIVLEKFADEL